MECSITDQLPEQCNTAPDLDTVPELRRSRSTPPVAPRLRDPPLNSQARNRFSVDASAFGTTSRSTVAEGGDHLFTSGLHRIRQGFPYPAPPITTQIHTTSYSQTALSVPGSRLGSISLAPTSPLTMNSCEDLTRFPSESLHSFSFAHQSEDMLHSRQNILKRSLEFMRDKFSWAVASPMITSHAKVTGDEEVHNVMDLLQRANLVNKESTPMLTGPLSGPAGVEGNPFEKTFENTISPSSTDRSKPAAVFGPGGLKGRKDVKSQGDANSDESRSEGSSRSVTSRSATNESFSTAKTSPPPTRRASLKRTYTDTTTLTLQTKLMDALAQPYIDKDEPPLTASSHIPLTGTSVHSHSNRYAPTSQAILTTDAKAPWTILAANDIACLVFGLTQAEIRRTGIMEVIAEERQEWLKQKLESPDGSYDTFPYPHSHQSSPNPSCVRLQNGGVGSPIRRAQTSEAQFFALGEQLQRVSSPHHSQKKSRGVLLCGDVVPVQKRNGNCGSASLWVKEKKGGLIWVLEEINEDTAYVFTSPTNKGKLVKWSGETGVIFGDAIEENMDIGTLIPGIPRSDWGDIDFKATQYNHNFTAWNNGIAIPCGVTPLRGQHGLKVSSFPHIAGIIVLSASTLLITSSNSAFAAALFGHSEPTGLHIAELIPNFDRLLRYLIEEDKIVLVDGMVVPEHSFRKAKAMLSLREGREGAEKAFSRQIGLPAKHRDGSELRVDVQMRVVKSTSTQNEAIVDDPEEHMGEEASETVYALWITYSRDLHGVAHEKSSSEVPRTVTPPRPSPSQFGKIAESPRTESTSSMSSISQHFGDVSPLAAPTPPSSEDEAARRSANAPYTPPRKKTISDFHILEDMGQGAYGQVKLARYKRHPSRRVILKYVTKKRILVETWTRDRRLGTVPLEIHVLDYLGRGLKHSNIVEMLDFFEDDLYYYIEMVPHGLPGMDLFDYIELRVNMDEDECRNIFVQVCRAIGHLHTKALVVHRDIKDENIVLDGHGNIKLIDFGSAAYIAKGPFDVFVGTIDYAAPEVLAGRSYKGKEQDIWALGVLLYTITYKENPFYNVDEIMDGRIRVPHVMSENNLDLIRIMLNLNEEERPTIEQVLAHPWFEGLPESEEVCNSA